MRRAILPLVVVLTLALAAPTWTLAVASVACDGSLHALPTDSLAETDLFAVSAAASDDVWIVGRHWDASQRFAIAMHWDGALWTKARLAHPQRIDVKDVVAFSATDVWAVGRTTRVGGGTTRHTTVQHWDGTAWTETMLRTGLSIAWGIDGTGSDDLWIVGQRNRRHHRPSLLVWHFDGRAWTRFDVPPPTREPNPALFDVDVRSADDVWAVGRYGRYSRTLAVHWDGKSWTRVATPSASGQYSYSELRGVAAIASDDVWAVGTSDRSHPLAVHYDGVSFSESAFPTADANLTDVDAAATDDVWAVGLDITSSDIEPPGAWHWDGAAWSRVQIEDGTERGYYEGVGVAPDGEVTAVGNAVGDLHEFAALATGCAL